MLDLGAPVVTRDGVTLARDQHDPRRWLAMPPAPRVARLEGAPQVELLRFIEGGTLTGGHLRLSVELAHPAGRLEEIEQALRDAERDPEITVGAVPVLDATAQVFFAGRETDAEGAETPLLRRLYGETVPALDPPHRASFAATLTPDGVRVMEAALRSGGAPVGVVYRLQTEGMRPARRIVARVDWSRVYEQVSAHARAGRLLLVDDLFRLSERLVEQRVIAIDVVQAVVPTGDEPADDSTREALDWIRRTIIERFCEPVLPLSRETARASLGPVGEFLEVGAAVAVRDRVQVERGVATIDLQRAAVVVRTLTVQSHLRDLLGGADPDDHIVDAGVDHPFFKRASLHLCTARPLQDSFVRELIGEWAYGATRAALRLDGDRADGRFESWADATPDRSWTLQLAVTLADDAPVDPGQVVNLPALSGRDAELTLDLDRLLGRRSVTVVATPDPERVLLTRAALRHLRGAEALGEQELVFTGEAPRQVTWLRDWRSGDRVELTPEYLLKAGTRVRGEALEVDTAVFNLPPAYPGVMTVQLFAEEGWAGLERVIVEVQKRDDLPLGLFTFTQGGTTQAVNLDLPDPADRTFRYRMTRTWSDGRADQDDWITTDVAAVLVGPASANLLTVEVVPLGPELPSVGVVLIEVELLYVDVANQVREQHTALVRGRADRPRWEVGLRDPTQRSYEYRVTVHRTSGAPQVGPWLRSSERILPVPITPA